MATFAGLWKYYTCSSTVSNRIENSQQFDGKSFLNPGANLSVTFSTTLASTWEFLFKGKDRKPSVTLPRQEVDMSIFQDKSEGQLRTTWLGHSSLMLNIDGYYVLIDPVFEKSVSFFGPTRYNGEVPLVASELPEIDLILISHNHYDHLNEYSIKQIQAKTSMFVVPLGVSEMLQEWGVPQEKIVELDWWEDYKVSEAFKITSTPAQHFSGRGIKDRNMTLWCSYVIKSKNHSLYFSGDSGYFDGFKKIGKKYGPFDLTFLECGAYNLKWKEIHMMPEETIQAHLDLRGKILHPIHWGTYDLAAHSWYEPMQRLSTAAELKGVKIATPIVGGTTILSDNMKNEKWWESVLQDSL